MTQNYIEFLQAQPSSVTDSVELSNAVFDYLFMSSDIDCDVDFDIFDWDDSVLLYAEFNNSLVAGGLMYTSAEDGFLIKRKSDNDFLWTTIGFISSQDFYPLPDSNQYVGYFIDITSIPTEKYKYTLTPVADNLELEGEESDDYITCKTNGLTVLDASHIYYAYLEANLDSITQNSASTIVNTINGKYPYAYKLGDSNYITGNACGMFEPYLSDSCHYLYTNSDDENNTITKYRKSFREWLCNGNVKIIKYYDGRAYLAAINDNPSDDDSEHHAKNITTFTFTEVGDINSNLDLLNSGLIVDNYEDYKSMRDKISAVSYVSSDDFALDNIEKIINKILE